MNRHASFLGHLLAVPYLAVPKACGQNGLSGVELDRLQRPVRSLELQDAYMVMDVAYSPDGNTVYAVTRPDGVSVWEVTVYYWPELLGVVLAITILLFALLVLRVHRRPRRMGLAYCRKCNYCLSSVSSDRCPECGAIHARRAPVLGRGRW